MKDFFFFCGEGGVTGKWGIGSYRKLKNAGSERVKNLEEKKKMAIFCVYNFKMQYCK